MQLATMNARLQAILAVDSSAEHRLAVWLQGDDCAAARAALQATLPLPKRYRHWLQLIADYGNSIRHWPELDGEARWSLFKACGSLRAQHSSVRQRGSALVNQTEDVGWLYARIYCAGGDDTDALLPEIAQWLARARGQWDIRSAHFLRFVDLRGHHIRLRLKAVQGVLDDAYASMRELGAVAQRTEVRTVERLVSDPMTGGIGASRPGIAFGVYGPEYGKYGGVAGVEEAERHFYVSSRWCLDHQIWQIPRPVPRAALAARFLALAARSAPLPEAELLSAHLRMWGSRLPAHLRDGSALGPIVQQLLEVIEFQFDEIPSWSKAAGALGELADDAGRAIGAMGAGTDGRRALDLLHIDVNRLGLNPAEECIAGLCARQLLSGGAAPPAQPSAAAG